MTTCVGCQQSPGTHWCNDCFGSNIWCDDCCVSGHKNYPFHQVQMWNGQFFQKSNILQGRLTIHLPHHPDSCSSIPLNVEVDNPSDLDILDEMDDLVNQSKPTCTQESGTNFRSQSKLIIVSSTRIFRCSFWWCHCVKLSDKCIQHFIHARPFWPVSRTLKLYLHLRSWITSEWIL